MNNAFLFFRKSTCSKCFFNFSFSCSSDLCTDYEEENVRTEGISQIYLQNSEGGVQKKRGKKLAKEIDHDALAKNVVTSGKTINSYE